MTGLYDSFRRPINYLRISVTDRCNLRCLYCMPEKGICQISHNDVLSYEEIRSIVIASVKLGIKRVRLTGGEPLVRSGICELVRMIEKIEAIDDISLTTNGTLLTQCVAGLKQAGLKRVNVSLDTLRPDRFTQITRSRCDIGDVISGINSARLAGLEPVKVNVVVMAGINEDEVIDFAKKTITDAWNVRFIEFMPAAGVLYQPGHFIPVKGIRKLIQSLGELEPVLPAVGNGPARYFRFPGSTGTIGFISPVSEHFCFRCNRLRLTADGKLRPCLLSDYEIDLKGPIRSGISSAQLRNLISEAVKNKPLRHNISGSSISQGRPMAQVGG